jgi:hypothetical protein
MPRSSQYQSAGNPIQTRLLPDRRPTLAFPYHPLTSTEESQVGRRAVLFLLLLSVASIFSQLLQIPAQAGISRSVIGTNIVLVAVACFLIPRLIQGTKTLGLREAVIALPLVFFYLNAWPSLNLHLLILASSMSLLTYQIGRHWIAYCTASPRSRLSAKGLTEPLLTFLFPMAAFPLGLYFAAQFLSPRQLVCLAVALPVVQVIFALVALDGDWKFQSAVDAIRSWLTYNSQDADIPGTLRSPSGPWTSRIALTGWCVFLVAATIIRLPLAGGQSSDAAASPFGWFLVLVNPIPPEHLQEHGLSFDGGILWILSMLATALAPALVVLLVPTALLFPLLLNAAQFRRSRVTPEDWAGLTYQMNHSDDPIERDSVFGGVLKCDGSPTLVHTSVYGFHAHMIGDSGSGKTARGLSPTVEQLMRKGKATIIAIDLKGDSHELFAAMLTGAERARQEKKLAVPVKFFTNKPQQSTFAFNPLTQPYWKSLGRYVKTDILCGALGLTYGADYGEGYYSSANSAVLYQTIKQYPEVGTFRELADRVGYVIANAKKSELHPEIRKSGVHVQTVLDRLGSFEALNVAPGTHSEEVVQGAIDLTQAFAEPQAWYFQLSAMIAPGSAPEIGRLVVYSLLAAATQTQRNCQVYLVIDEFQRMVAGNLEYIFQLARSMDVGIILANQSMEDLKTSKTDLIPTIETNCRYRQWFSASGSEDRQRLVKSGGETVETEVSHTYGQNDRGPTQSVTYSERVVPRLCENDVLLASDDPRQSILKISRGAGYAQYGGMPVIIESDFHISKQEYDRRVLMPWPENVNGSFVPQPDDGSSPSAAAVPNPPPPASPVGPTVTTEVIEGREKANSKGGRKPGAKERAPAATTETLFDDMQTPSRRRPRRKETT